MSRRIEPWGSTILMFRSPGFGIYVEIAPKNGVVESETRTEFCGSEMGIWWSRLPPAESTIQLSRGEHEQSG